MGRHDRPAGGGAGMSAIYVTGDGYLYLECFADDPDAEKGVIIAELAAGDRFDDLAAKVAAHITEHGCEQDGYLTGQLAAIR